MASEDTDKIAVLQGTLDLIVLRTLRTMGRQHAYAIANRLQQVSGDQLCLNQGTLYPALVRLEQQGRIRAPGARRTTTAKQNFIRSPKLATKRWLRKRCAGGECRGWWKSCFPKGCEACADSSPDSAIYFRRAAQTASWLARSNATSPCCKRISSRGVYPGNRRSRPPGGHMAASNRQRNCIVKPVHFCGSST